MTNQVEILKAIKAQNFYNASAVQALMNEVEFANEYEATLALWKNDWDTSKAYQTLMFTDFISNL